MPLGQDGRRHLHRELLGRGAGKQVNTRREHARLPTTPRVASSVSAPVRLLWSGGASRRLGTPCTFHRGWRDACGFSSHGPPSVSIRFRDELRPAAAGRWDTLERTDSSAPGGRGSRTVHDAGGVSPAVRKASTPPTRPGTPPPSTHKSRVVPPRPPCGQPRWRWPPIPGTAPPGPSGPSAPQPWARRATPASRPACAAHGHDVSRARVRQHQQAVSGAEQSTARQQLVPHGQPAPGDPAGDGLASENQDAV